MDRLISIIGPAIPQTLIMVFASTFIAIVLGLPLGVILTITRKDGLCQNLKIYSVLDKIINILRSFPFIVVFPLSRILVGKAYGTAAMIIPLSISAAPFVARLMEGYFNQIDKGIIEAAKSVGSTNMQIITRVLIPEAMPMIVNGITMTLINVVGYSAMAGAIGGGGLGDIAIRYGYQMRDEVILWSTVVLIILIVQIVQVIGNRIEKKIDRRF